MLPGPQARDRGGSLQFPGQPSDRSTPHTPGSSWAPAPGSLVPSVAFAVKVPARLPLGPLPRVSLTAPQASLHAADRPVATPLYGGVVAPLRLRDLARRREPRYRGPWRVPGPDSHRLAVLSLSLGYTAEPPFVPCARAAGRTLRPEKVASERALTRSFAGKGARDHARMKQRWPRYPTARRDRGHRAAHQS